MARLAIKKTYKLYIDGKFPRTESGRYLEINGADICRGSKKDLRDAVLAARKALGGWSRRTPYLRGQILYRCAEMLETRKAAFVEELTAFAATTPVAARHEVEKAIDRLVWYAGWADKFAQSFGTVNPVAAPYFNFTLPEPLGVVGLVAPDEAPLLGLVSKIAPAIVIGNTCVAIASATSPCSAISFAEALATADVPAGVVNILTGLKEELIPVLARHMDVNGIDYSGHDAATIRLLQTEAAESVKRIVVREHPAAKEWLSDAVSQSPYWIAALAEMKTAWHPIGT
ncbi:MAG: aldehyde dehydrogenase family protein [Deltaproteobacteria bacterium]|nr:aldehyde dehydrogenase family protein [Deltaproteobacteria bacterium]